MKLYHQPMTRSSRVRWLLAELDAPHEVAQVDVFMGEGRKPEYRQVNPHGFVPALEVDGQVLLESSAICMFLADRHLDKGLAPAHDSPLRAKYYQWMVYVPATCDPAIEAIMFHTRFLPEEKRLPALVETSKKKWKVCERVLAEGIGAKPWILGDTFSAADVVVASTLGWARFAGVLSDDPTLAAYLERATSRPGFVAGHAS
jgi:glutathione S-transferase